jgi:chromate transporter
MPRLAAVFAWIGVSSIGGGRSAYVYEVLVERRRWLTGEEFMPGYALSQLLPGPTITNLAVFLGHKLHGVWGAVIGFLSVLLPGAVSLLVLTDVYFAHGQGPQVSAALRGMGGAVVGFICVTAVRMGRGAFDSRGGLWIAALTFAAVGLFRVNALVVLLLGVPVSLWLNRPRRSVGGAG